MSYPESTLLEFLRAPRDRSVRFVFPTQATADAWARRLARMPGVGAVESDRFLGWDSLREILTRPSIPPDRTEATDAHRLLWADALAAGSGSPAFAAFHARIAPSLQALAAACPGMTRAERGGALAGYLELFADYRRFLDRNSLYEPGFLAAAPLPLSGAPGDHGGCRYMVFGAELLHDFAAVARAAGSPVESRPMPAGPPHPRLELYSDSRKEYVRVFGECARLMDSGVAAADLAISVTDSGGNTRAQLASCAADSGVPISFRWTQPLARAPFGMLLSAIQSAGAAGCALDSLAVLLRFRGIPWKEGTQEHAGALLRFGARYRVLEQTGNIHSDDIWESTFARCPHDPGTRSFYRSVSRAVAAICEAKRFDRLRASIHAFRDTFLDESQVPAQVQRTTERVMEELESLDRASRMIRDSGADPGRPRAEAPVLRLLMASIAASRYVAQGSPGSIPVYPYGTAPLHPAKAHFVLDASHTGLRLPSSPFEFLGDEEIELLEPGLFKSGSPETDPSTLMAAAHGHREGAVFCHAGMGVSGWSVPHPCFLGWGIRGEDFDAEARAAQASGPVRRELEAWDADDSLPLEAPPLPAQLKDSGLLAATHPARDGWRASEPAGPEGRAAARKLFLASREDGRLRFSPSSLADMAACPMRAFLSRTPMGHDEIAPGEIFPAPAAGELAHSAIRALFAGIAGSGPFDSAKLSTYEALVPGAIEEAYRGLTGSYGPLAASVGREWRPLLADRLVRLLRAESWMEGWDPGEFEMELSMDVPGEEIVFEGRADRIAHRDGRYAIVDFKKGKIPREKDLAADADGGLADFQLTSYAMLCEAMGMEVERACFWSVEKARRLVGFGPEGARATAADYAPERKIVLDMLAAAGKKVRDGGFLLPDPESGPCAECAWKGACRATFASERLS